jgi:hypothetical protein
VATTADPEEETVFGIGFLVYLLGLPLFGGEDPLGPAPDGDNWHHEGLTRRAARRAGWSAAAENAVAFHADYVDSYLYNPLWWLNPGDGGGVDRLRVVMSSRADLVKVHFDDLFAPDAVGAMWRRYLSGTVCGLLWLARQDVDRDSKVAMAHNLVGVSLHALQDFESHSNWIDDPARRPHTWFDIDPADRASLSLWTGSYELEDHLGVKPHGAYDFACSLFNKLGGIGRDLLRVACHAASPFAGSPLCGALGRCDEDEPISPPELAGVELPDGVVSVKPGINVDNHWMAVVGADQRGIELSGDQAFELAYELAFRTSCQWLHLLDHTMERAGLDAFWADVKTHGTVPERYTKDVAPWERLDQLPYRFISTGPYPPDLDPPDTDGWYLRLSVATADEAFAGTNADLVAFVDDTRVEPLDLGPEPASTEVDALLGVDDHERGATAAYYLGPFDTRPTRVAILNDAPTTLDVIAAAGQALLDAIVRFFDAIAGFFLQLVGAAADFVGQAHHVIGADQLEALTPGALVPFTIRCDGGSEGIYDVSVRVEATPITGVDQGIPWREYWVRVDDLYCFKESEWDRFTTSDEPFVVGVVIPHGGDGNAVPWRTDPYTDVDTGESRAIGRAFSVRVPRRFGFISVAVAVYESDDESPEDRDQLMNTFAGAAESSTAPAAKAFGVILSEAIAAAWRPARIEVAAFRRGPTAEVVLYAPFEPDRWVDGGQQLDWTLDQVEHLFVDVPDTIDCTCAPRCGSAEPPGRPRKQPPVAERPRLPRPCRPHTVPTVGVDGPRGRSATVHAIRRPADPSAFKGAIDGGLT